MRPPRCASEHRSPCSSGSVLALMLLSELLLALLCAWVALANGMAALWDTAVRRLAGTSPFGFCAVLLQQLTSSLILVKGSHTRYSRHMSKHTLYKT